MKSAKILVTVMLSLTLFFSGCIGSFADTYAPTIEENTETLSGEEATNYIDQAVALILSRYKFDVKSEQLYKAALKELLTNHPELLDEAFKGMFETLDDYSVYYTEEEMNSFLNDMSGEICGIGVLVMADDEGLIISKVYENTPAKEAGLIQGDIITHASGVFLGGMDIDLAKQYIIGQEFTPVTLTISRGQTSFDKTIVRRKVTIDSGYYQIVEDGTIGYIQLSEFSGTAAEFVKKALDEFDSIPNLL